MQAATERRQHMIEYLCEVRSTTRLNLMQVFHVSKNTVDRDLQLLMCSYPIKTKRGPSGGVRIAAGYTLGVRYMNEEQIELLTRLSETLTDSDKIVMQGLIRKYTKPSEDS